MAEDSAARFRASLDKLLYYDKDSGTAPGRATESFGGEALAADALAENPSNPNAITGGLHRIRRHEARPADRRDYLRRVQTFRPAVWFAKPPGLRPVDCARRGWTCVGVDTLECESCKARLLFAVPPTASNDDAKKLATMTQPKLDQNHEPSCGWRGTTCPASVARFPRVPDTILRVEFRERRDALLELEHVPEVCAITHSAGEDDGRGTAISGRFAPAAVARRLARLATSATSVETDLSTKSSSREISLSPARLRAATALALCGWTVAKREASSETKVDATLAASPAWSPSPRRGARRASLDGKVTGSILRCALCDAKAATWNFADARETSSSARRLGTAEKAGASPYQKKKRVSSATALMGAMGGAFGPSVFDAAPPEPNPAGPGPGSGAPAGAPAPAGGSETNRIGTSPVMSLGLSIAGGGTPSRAALGAGRFGIAAASPPAFGAGAARDAPFGAPGGLVRSPAPVASAKRKRDDSSSYGASGGTAARTPVPTPAPTPLPTPPNARSVSAASGSVPESTTAFHPLRRHRAHCPWSAQCVVSSEVSKDFQFGERGGSARVTAQPGWQCVLDAVAPFESADGDAVSAAPGRAAEEAPDDRNDFVERKKPPGRLEEYSGLSGRNAVASYLAGE
jgi:hypothetical protein